MKIIPAYTGDVIPSPFTPDEKFVFTNGDCWELARAISEEYGYPVVSAASKENDRYWWHAANLLPDGTILDIDGVWTQGKWLHIWNARKHDGKQVLKVKQYTHQEWVDVIYWGLLKLQYPEMSVQSHHYAARVVSLIPPM